MVAIRVNPKSPTDFATEVSSITPIPFDAGSSILSAGDLVQEAAKRLEALLKEHPNGLIVVRGHRDQGDTQALLVQKATQDLNGLPLKRAQVVRDYLVKFGLPTNRLGAFGAVPGIENAFPVEVCHEDTAECHTRNRSVDFVSNGEAPTAK
jgi:outer membrane protein OmpA-like peptidoglycan-associated protein